MCAGSKSRCRENTKNIVVVIDNVSCLPDLAQGTPYSVQTTRSRRAHSPPGIKALSIPPLAMLVTNASFVFKDGGGIQQEAEVENILASMCALCYYACGETG